MSERYVPVFMVGSCLRCLIVGGGIVAQRKAAGLLSAGSTITVVSPTLTPRLSSWAKRGSIAWVPDTYRTSHSKGANLVIGATDDTSVNERVFRDAVKAGIPVNVVDDPAHCTFIVPSAFKKGPFQVALSTGGAAPALAAKLRRQFEETISDEHVIMVTELKKMRPEIKLLDAIDKAEFWRSMVSLNVSPYKGKPSQLKGRLRAELKRRSKVKARADVRKGGAA
jgi:precorrin-2 dehydrogenase / sirohydrochlorin ferrochelatase